MGATDIRLSLGFRSHPKTKKLARRLGNEGVLSFIWLMMFAAESRPDGDLGGMDDEDIALAASWSGEATPFVQGLVECKFLEGKAGAYRIHDWQEHNPWAAHAGERSERAKRAAEARWARKDNQGDTSRRHADRMQDALNGIAPSPTPTPTPEEDLGEASPPPVGQEADGGQAGLFGNGQAGNGKPAPVPHQAIIDLYHETLPELPPVKVWNSERQGFLRARWREDPQRQNLAWWRAFFLSVRERPHLMGQNDRNWLPNLEWLVRPNNFAKILEGYYRRRAGPAMLSQKGQRTAAAAAEVLGRMDREQEEREQARAS